MRIIGIPRFRGGVVVGGPVSVGVGEDWFRCRGVIRGLVRGIGRLRDRCAGGCSPCVYGIVGIPRFCGSIVAGRRVAVGSVTDWIGFRVSFSDSVRGSVSMGD